MIYFVSCNRDQRIMLGEDPSLYPILRADPNTIFFNLLGFYSIGKPLMNIIPPAEICYDDDVSFKYKYSAMLQMNPEIFFDLMSIMINEYYGYDVVVVTDLNHPLTETVVDCVIEWFYIRYGFQCAIINTLEDKKYCKDGEIQSEKMQVFMRDKEYFTRESIDPKELLNSLDQLEELNINEI